MSRRYHPRALALITVAMLVSACGMSGDSTGEGDPGATLEGVGDGEIAGRGDGDGGAGLDAAGAGESAPSAASGEGDFDDAAGFSGGGEALVAPPTMGGGQGGTQAGILTAGAWDDNRNFEHFSAYRSDMAELQLPGAMAFTDEEFEMAHEVFGGERPGHATLDIALVIDTTGSMGDEIRYLQTEFDAIASTIESEYPDSEQRWSLVVYRDTTDAYVARWFDFRDNAEDFRSHLAAQQAEGGGDFPEAADAALETMGQLAWRTSDATARLAFWVADAPHHDDRAQAMADAIRVAQTLDVHIYPVASSGIDDLSELTMRSAAQLTGGRYLFLTDDSGVGGAHAEPTIPCYFVTRLDQAILRMVDIELTGAYREPEADHIIRTGGDPSDGACTLASGQQVVIF